IEQMARVKSVLPETVFPHGFAILNADDDLVYAMRKGLDCNIALFSMDENNPRIIEHCKKGGIAAVFENDYVTILKGTWKIRVDKVSDIPLTFGGKAIHNIMNTLPAILATYLFKGIKIEDIKLALQTFIPSPALTPGRLNMFSFKEFKMLVDFAHNPAGLQLLCDFVSKLDGSPKVGIISGTGDRRDEDIRELGRIAARYFDEIIIREDTDLRGRTSQNMQELILSGINEARTRDIPITTVLKESDAIQFAHDHAKPGSLITIMCDNVANSLELVKSLKEKEDKRIG
ncbi:MAG: cyanophycin synthetase, partial [Chitinophagaceae bacterium]|nr:cyanophycin synthetase [Chitinophagaceae bacterium]